MRLTTAIVAAAVVAAVSIAGALAAPPAQLRLSGCVNTNTPQQLVISQTWKNAGPATFAGKYDIVYDFISSLQPFVADSLDLQYIANAGGLVSGSQTDTFNPFIGPSGQVPWNTYIRIDVTYVVGGTTTVSSTLTQPKNGWRTCK